MSECLIGLDIGTTNCKAIAASSAGDILYASSYEYSLVSPNEGQYMLKPEVVWAAVCTVLKDVAENADRKIIGISISSQGEAFLPVDRAGNPLFDIMVTFDLRAKSQLEALRSRLGDRSIFNITGMIPHPMHTICKLAWFKEHYPLLHSRTDAYHFMGDLILKKLGGNALVDHSLAARSMAYDIHKKEWSSEILDATGIDVSKLPKVVCAGENAGVVSDTVAQDLSLPTGVKLIVGGHDQACAALGCGVITPKSAMNSVGTTEVLMTCTEHMLHSDTLYDGGFVCYPHVVPNKYVIRGNIPSSGSALKWCVENLFQDVKRDAVASGDDPYSVVFNNLSDKAPSLLVLPYLAGRGTPRINPEAKAAILGLTLSHSRYDIFHALVEALSFELKQNIDAFGRMGFSFQEIRAVGGGAKSEKWLKMKADLTGCNITTYNSNAASLGAVMIAAHGLDPHQCFEEIVSRFVHPIKIIKPSDNSGNDILEKRKDLIRNLEYEWC